MANEATIITLLGNAGDPIEYTVADGTGIEKGTLMELTDPVTAKKISAVDVPIAGILANEKVADDGQTKVAVLTHAKIEMNIISGGSATIGDHVSSAGATNEVNLSSTLDNEKGWAVGKSLEDAASGDTCVILMNL